MLLFQDLWIAHPYVQNRNQFPCDLKNHRGDALFEHQCAIKLGSALWAAGMNPIGYTGKTCGRHGGRHPLAAEELARWLVQRPHDVGPMTKYTKVTDVDFRGRTGIMLCKDFWGTHHTGDHIDLWDGAGRYRYPWDKAGTEKKPGEPGFAKGLSGWIAASKEVWFWQLL